MRELTYFVAVSLDGRIAGPGDDFSAFPTTGDHLDMIAADYRDTLPGHGLAALRTEDGLDVLLRPDRAGRDLAAHRRLDG